MQIEVETHVRKSRLMDMGLQGTLRLVAGAFESVRNGWDIPTGYFLACLCWKAGCDLQSQNVTGWENEDVAACCIQDVETTEIKSWLKQA